METLKGSQNRCNTRPNIHSNPNVHWNNIDTKLILLLSLQSLGGALNPRSTRNTLITNAKQERERRELVRRQNEVRGLPCVNLGTNAGRLVIIAHWILFPCQHQNAIRIQAVVRSYICRKKAKDLERKSFDEHLQKYPLASLDDLQYLLVRLLFFYDRGDEQRFIAIGLYILKNTGTVFDQVAVHPAWRFRVNRLLLLSINQLFASECSYAIPLRLLELFTDSHVMHAMASDPSLLQPILETTFSFLVRHGFFSTMRKLLEHRTPPLDGPTALAPTPFCDAILQLLVRPLAIVTGVVAASVT